MARRDKTRIHIAELSGPAGRSSLQQHISVTIESSKETQPNGLTQDWDIWNKHWHKKKNSLNFQLKKETTQAEQEERGEKRAPSNIRNDSGGRE